MARRLLALLSLVAVAAGCATPQPPLRLVVVVSVDQMRADFLTRFAEQYDSGLARVTAQGRVFSDAHQDHALTVTAAGHAAISTGAYPSRNGIVGNEWWDRHLRRSVYSAEDESVFWLNESANAGSSPANLLRSTLGDWLKQASPQSKVFSVAIKDRVAVLLAGKEADGAYWYDRETGHFVSSTYYMDSHPAWVQSFNAAARADRFAGAEWTRLRDETDYALSREDAFAAEADGTATTFPHALGDPETPDSRYYWKLIFSPFGDRLTFEFAREMLVAEELGSDDTTDLLWIGCSSADAIGHVYGPYSQEVQDYYLRLDRMLGELLELLDERVGPSAYVLVLTGDHGVVPMPEELERRGVEARRIAPQEAFPALQAALQRTQEALGLQDAEITAEMVGGVVLRGANGALTPEQEVELRSALAAAIREADFVADAYTYDELLNGCPADRPFCEAYRRSFHPERSADVMIRLREHHLLSGPTGTSHGSPYAYDTHVPLVFFGGSVAGGDVDTRVRTVDIAPTLARLLDLATPDDLDGEVLSGVSR